MLLDLPAELRNTISELVAIDHPHELFVRNQLIPPLYVNRQLWAESRGFFALPRCIVVTASDTEPWKLVPTLVQWLESLSAQRRAELLQLTMVFGPESVLANPDYRANWWFYDFWAQFDLLEEMVVQYPLMLFRGFNFDYAAAVTRTCCTDLVPGLKKVLVDIERARTPGQQQDAGEESSDRNGDHESVGNDSIYGDVAGDGHEQGNEGEI
ncbi:hypothetical protein LTR56_022025 [Elasticomyces elasticus]|nr:hypothetical protein LTR56_022025 [Elasticomyces elasticus]KAK3635041.1 hypothetical protein LTR22_019397 [Elasticomyces elasticus]KAK4915778.1 hypothetical protein LTR49_016147 [Elasticomyces elasticus]KAK5749440.1 hypothetical protein LTS12_020489 [Elasticomyces elasticus]